MSSTIRETVTATLSAQGISADNGLYSSYVDSVVSALEEREFTNVETLISNANEAVGYSEGTTKPIIESAGFEIRPVVVIPEPEVVAEEAVAEFPEGSPEAALALKVDNLAVAVASLVTLANNRFGANL